MEEKPTEVKVKFRAIFTLIAVLVVVMGFSAHVLFATPGIDVIKPQAGDTLSGNDYEGGVIITPGFFGRVDDVMFYVLPADPSKITGIWEKFDLFPDASVATLDYKK